MRRAILFAMLAALPAATFATPITIDVMGTVLAYVTYEDSEDGVDLTGTLSNLNVSASYTYDIDFAPPPILDNDPVFGITLTRASIGAPLAEFVAGSVTWAHGTYVPFATPVPSGALEVGDVFLAYNDDTFDDQWSLIDRIAWQTEDLEVHLEGVVLTLRGDGIYPDPTFVPDSADLPPLDSPQALGGVQSLHQSADGALTGYQMVFEITSATIRQVPEPGTLALLLAGFAGLVVRRRRT